VADEKLDQITKAAALIAELEPLVRGHHKELSSVGSLIEIKKWLQEL
jgi:hypothetical protein